MTASDTPPPRRRGPIIALIILIVVIIAVAAALIIPRLHAKVIAISTSPTTTPTASPTTAAAPSGCLGGSQRDSTMLLSAQKTAPHTTTGAVEVAAAFVRWTFRHPTPSAYEANEVGPMIISSTATADFKNLAAAFAANPNPSGGAVADGVNFYVSTGPGVWYVDHHSTDQVTVSVGAGYVVQGTLNPSLRSSSTFTLIWQQGRWRIQSGELAHTTEQLFQIGRAFTGGC